MISKVHNKVEITAERCSSPNHYTHKKMTNREFQQTKRILLGQERMNKKYAQLAHYIQERFSVQVINVTCSKIIVR